MSTELIASRMGANDELALAIENAVIEFRIEEELEKCHFFGQMHVETRGFTALRENLNYSVAALISLFGRHRISIEDAQKYGRIDGQQPANQQAIANILYGGDFGKRELGNTQPGDGWKYRGRGLKHLTGAANYRRCSLALFGDLRLLDNPELLEQPVAAARSAGWFWTDKNIKPLAMRDDVEAVTRRVNGGINGLADRQRQTDRAKQLFRELRRT